MTQNKEKKKKEFNPQRDQKESLLIGTVKKSILKNLNVTCDDEMVIDLLTDLERNGYKLMKYDAGN